MLPTGRMGWDLDNECCRVRLGLVRTFKNDNKATTGVMRHPQGDLLIVFALVELARDYREMLTENYLLEWTAEVADQ